MNGKPWSARELLGLQAMYPHCPTGIVAELLGHSVYSVNGAAHKLGLHKTEEYLASPEACRLRRVTPGEPRVGAAYQFQKGQVPANKGLRRPGYAPGRMKETQFRKGQRSANWKPIGTVMTDSDGYQRIKISEGLSGFGNPLVWPFLQRHTWEQHHGPIPPGHVVAFKDGKRENCAIENLECISRADLARRNAMWNRFPPELIKAITLNGAIKRKLRRLQQ